MGNRHTVCLFLLIGSAFALPAVLPAETILQQGDRVVIYGDSITQQRLYSRYLQQYVNCRYPDLNVRFFNAGWSGDRATGAFGRLERDVLHLNPTVVTLFFGMNDGGYKAVDDGTVKTYRVHMEKIITRLKEEGVRVVVYTPGCVDPDRRQNLADCDYNSTLEALATAAIEVAKAQECPYADIFHPMLEYQARRKQSDPDFTMIPDAVHPDPAGHLVMTYHMLKGLGAEPMPLIGAIDIAEKKLKGVKIADKNKNQLVLETTDPVPVPFWFEAKYADTMRSSGFLTEFAGQKLIARGLRRGAYEVIVGGDIIGRYSPKQLANGIRLAGSYSRAGKAVHDTIREKENLYYSIWRSWRLNWESLPGVSENDVIGKLMAAHDAMQDTILQLCQPVPSLRITLIPAPQGENLALNKSYECSDPNRYNWGIGKLTDGSWQADSQHCFASGDKDTFPKHVTIDLGETATIGLVRFGVPPFGSTKTVNVSISADNETFTDVGTHTFQQKEDERATVAFDNTDARYVRLTYPDHYDTKVSYGERFVFTTEVEVYRGQ